MTEQDKNQDQAKANESILPPQENAANTLYGEHYTELKEAVELLYIGDNLGGRINFYKEFSIVAAHLFGEELIEFDAVGTDDKKRRAVLEDEAEERRLALQEVIETLEDKSVHKGALQLEYVEGIVRKYGRDISLFLYSDRIVSKYIPAPAEQEKTEKVQQKPPVQEPATPQPEQPPENVQALDAPSVQESPAEEHQLPISEPHGVEPTSSESPAVSENTLNTHQPVPLYEEGEPHEAFQDILSTAKTELSVSVEADKKTEEKVTEEKPAGLPSFEALKRMRKNKR